MVKVSSPSQPEKEDERKHEVTGHRPGALHTDPDSGQGEQTKVDSREPAAREEERSGFGFSTKPRSTRDSLYLIANLFKKHLE